MAKILAIDCALACSSVALAVDNAITRRHSDEVRGNAGNLLPMIDALLAERGIGLKQLDALCTTHGPGSFTGIRIGLSIVQGLAYGAGLSVFPFTTLELMAWSYCTQSCHSEFPGAKTRLILPVLDARMDEVYWATYSGSPEGGLQMHSPPRLSLKENLLNELQQTHPGVLLVAVGEALEQTVTPNDTLQIVQQKPGVAAVSMLELLDIEGEKRESIENVSTLEPLYLRNALSWKKRTRIRSQGICQRES